MEGIETSKRHDDDVLQSVIIAASAWLAWMLQYPQSPGLYPEAIARLMRAQAPSLAPLRERDVDRAASWLTARLWQRFGQSGEEESEAEEGVVLFATSWSGTPDTTLRQMGEEALGLGVRELALRLPPALEVRLAATGEAFAAIASSGYVQVLSPDDLSHEPGGALVCFQVPVTEGERAVLRGLGAAFSADGRFLCLGDEQQRWRAALTAHALPANLEDGLLHLPPAQGGAATGAHLYRVLNRGGAAWQPWLAWILTMNGCDSPWEAPRPAPFESSMFARSPFESEPRPPFSVPFAPEEDAPGGTPARAVQPEERGPLASLRELAVQALARATYEEGIEIPQALLALEAEGALLRWQALLDTVERSLGRRERRLMESAMYVSHASDLALLVYALTGRADLVMSDGDQAPALHDLPQGMAWVWGIPLATLEQAERAEVFLVSATNYHMRDRYELSFVLPDGQAAPVPVLYGLTVVEQAGSQLRWLATGEGLLPL